MTDEKTNLARMDLDDLRHLRGLLDCLIAAGDAVASETTLEFDLSPGQPVTMRLCDLPMPAFVAPPHPPMFGPRMSAIVTSDWQPKIADAAPPEPDPGAAPVPGDQAEAQADSQPARRNWTPEDEAQAVQLVATGVVHLGLSKKAAQAEAAQAMGRSASGFEWKCRHLMPRIEALMDEIRATSPVEDPARPAGDGAGSGGPGEVGTAPPAATPDPAPPVRLAAPEGAGDSGASSSRPAAARAAPLRAAVVPPVKPPAPPARDVPAELRPVAAHLRGVTPFGKWTPDLDRELMRLAEEARWPLHEICLELGFSTAQAQQRFSALTRANAYRRAEVWAAMQAIGYGEAAKAQGVA